jgi:hypothetical protein
MKEQQRVLSTVLALALGMTLLPAAHAGTAPRGRSLDGAVLPTPPAAPAAPEVGPGDNWIDHFDTYVTGSQLHSQGGWVGWDNSAAAGALTSDTQSRSAPNSVDVLLGSDLVHQYSGFTTGTWIYTAYQYIPTGTTGQPYFILLNTYAHGGPNNWSTQLCFDIAANVVRDDTPGNCSAGTPTLPLVLDQWVPIRVVIDLDTNTQTLFYNDQQLYQDVWLGHVSDPPTGAVAIAAVDLFANGSSSVFYDDLSLSNLPFLDGFESGDTREWHETVE